MPNVFKAGQRERIIAKTDGRCGYCGGRPVGKDLQVDHMIPRNRGGDTIDDNLVTACKRCNNLKKTKTPKEFKEYIFGMAHLKALEASLKREDSWAHLINENVEALLDRVYADCIEKLEALVETSQNNVTFYYETLENGGNDANS